jgi:magnesium chelatase accessory protein
MGTAMARRLDWDRDGLDWPNRKSSRFIAAGGVDWHVQVLGTGPVCLMLHGTGASTHSWRDLAPILAKRFTVVAPDLPGHGFSRVSDTASLSLTGMATALGALLQVLQLDPAIGVGHSAGAAILIEMCLDRLIAPQALVSLNGAFLPFYGVAGQIFSPIAKMLSLNPLVPRFFAWRAEDGGVVDRLLDSTGSRLEPDGVELYQRLASNPGHVSAALAMMANWDLVELKRRLGELQVPLTLIVGGDDRMIRPEKATVIYLRRLGHLAHEQQPDLIAEKIVGLAVAQGMLSDDAVWEALP